MNHETREARRNLLAAEYVNTVDFSNRSRGLTPRFDAIVDFSAGYDQCREDMQHLVEALRFYAERNNWRSPNYDSETKSEITISDLGVKSFNCENNYADFAIPSGGRRAREAIQRFEKGSE